VHFLEGCYHNSAFEDEDERLPALNRSKGDCVLIKERGADESNAAGRKQGKLNFTLRDRLPHIFPKVTALKSRRRGADESNAAGRKHGK